MTAASTAVYSVVFDLDGTLIDSIPDVVGALNRLLEEEGRRPISLDEGKVMVGEGAVPMVARAFATTGPEVTDDALAGLVERYLVFYRRNPALDTRVYAGVEEVLSTLVGRGVRLGVCTNKPHEMSELVLKALGLADHFEALVGGDVMAFQKPDPRHLFAVLDRLGGSADNTVFVGDSPIDVETAHNASVPFIGVTYGYGRIVPKNLETEILINDFADLTAALDRLSDGVTGTP